MAAELWWKAPVLLIRRFPTLFAGVLLGAAILGAAAMSGSAFIASSERASLRNELARTSRWTAGVRVTQPTTTFGPSPRPGILEELGRRGRRIIERLAADIEGVDRPGVTYFGSTGTLASDADEIFVRLVQRSEALEHVRFLDRSGEGLLIPDESARQLDVAVGDEVTIRGGEGHRVVRVAGTYRFLPLDRVRPFWAPYSVSIYREAGADTYPPAFVFATPGTFFDLAEAIGDYGDVHWEVPLTRTDLTLDEARDLDRRLQGLINDVHAGSSGFGDLIEDTVGSTRFGLGADTALPGAVRSAEERIRTVTPAVELLSLAARAVALAILAALGFYLVKRRRTEVATLVARGSTPLSVGSRAGVEAALPLAIGAAVGAAAGTILVARLGPAGGIDVDAALRSWSTLVTTLAVGALVLVAGVAATAAHEERAIGGVEHRRLPRTVIAAVGAAAAAAAAVAYVSYLQPAADTSDPAGLVPTLMPVVLILAAAIAGSAGIKVVLGWLTPRVRRIGAPMYLALRRLAAAPGMVQVLIAATAAAVGVMLYGTTVSASVEATAEAKARVFLGSDVSAQLSANADPQELPMRSTAVARVDRATLTNGLDLPVLAIDPETFEEAVYWEDGYADRPLADLIRSIAREGDRPRFIAVGPVPSDAIIGSARGDVALDIVGRASSFPGKDSEEPLLVTTRATFDRLLSDVGVSLSAREAELWAKGDPRRVRNVLLRSGIPFFGIATTEAVLETPALQSTLWTLGLLGALGAAAGLAGVGGLLLYIQARHRSALMSAALTRRMRLGRADELRSWLWEIGASMATSYVLAAAIGLGVAVLMNERLDLRPNLPPPPILVVPVGVLIGAAAAAAALVSLSAFRLRRDVDSADVAEILRT